PDAEKDGIDEGERDDDVLPADQEADADAEGEVGEVTEAGHSVTTRKEARRCARPPSAERSGVEGAGADAEHRRKGEDLRRRSRRVNASKVDLAPFLPARAARA